MPNASDQPSVPRLSAFVILIAGLLAVFALVDRLDRIVAHVSEAGSGTSLLAPGGTLDTAQRRVVAIIGGDAGSEESGTTPVPDAEAEHTATPPPGRTPDRAPVRETPEAANGGPDLAPNEGDPTAPAPETAEERERPILPRRPGRGTRLSDRELALGDHAPAEASDQAPPRGPQRSYSAAAPVGGRLPAHRASPAADRTRNARPTGSARPADDTFRHVLREDETLWSLAAKLYGNGKLYTEILRANPGLRADALTPGQEIRLPTPASLAPVGRALAAREED